MNMKKNVVQTPNMTCILVGNSGREKELKLASPKKNTISTSKCPGEHDVN